MPLVQISSDPFSRTDVVRETVPAGEREDCAWCGLPKAKFRYGINRVLPSARVFCSIDCWRTYHDLPR